MISAKNSRGGVKYLILLFCFIFLSFSVSGLQQNISLNFDFSGLDFNNASVYSCGLLNRSNNFLNSCSVRDNVNEANIYIGYNHKGNYANQLNSVKRASIQIKGGQLEYSLTQLNNTASNGQYMIVFDFDDPIYIQNSTRFSLSGQQSQNFLQEYQVYLITEDNNCLLTYFNNNNNDFDYPYANVCRNLNATDRQYFGYWNGYLNMTNASKAQNFTMSTIQTRTTWGQSANNSYFGLTRNDNQILVDKIAIGIEIPAVSSTFLVNGSIDNFLILNAVSGSNDMPTIDTFDYNLSECWAENTTSIDIALTINASDPENETLYYSLDSLNYLLRYSVNREDFEENGQPDLDFFTRGNYVSNNTYPESQQENSDFVAFNFDWVVNGQNLKHGIGAIGSNNYLLTRLEDAGTFYFQVDEPLINASFIDFEIAFPSVENGLDYVLFDSFGNRLINISFHLNQSESLSIYQDGILNKTIQFSNFHSGNYTGYIFVVNLFTNDGLTILLQDQDFIINETLHKTIDIQDFDRVGFFTHNRAMQSYDDYSPVWIMGNLIVSGWNYNPSIDWTTTKPTSIQVNDSDLIVVKLYVTDEYHKNLNEFTSGLLPINLQFCAYHVEPIGDDNIVGIFGGLTRNAVVDYLNAIGLYELGRKVVWLFFFFILIGMIAAEYMILRRVDFTFPLIAASGICMLMSLAALYVTEIIAFGLLLAFSLAAPLAIHFLSGENGRT